MTTARRPSSICHNCKRDLLGAGRRPGEGRHRGWAYELRDGVLMVQCRRRECRTWCVMPDELFELLWDFAVHIVGFFGASDFAVWGAMCARRAELDMLARSCDQQETP